MLYVINKSPAPEPVAHWHGGAIAAAILVPVALVGVASAYWFMRSRGISNTMNQFLGKKVAWTTSAGASAVSHNREQVSRAASSVCAKITDTQCILCAV